MSRYREGLKGEELAEIYLRKRGFQIKERRFRSRHGEIDLIAEKDQALYFIEVKYRPEGRLGSGLGAITSLKRKRLIDAMKAYQEKKHLCRKLAYLEVTRAGILFREDVLREN